MKYLAHHIWKGLDIIYIFKLNLINRNNFLINFMQLF